MRILAICGSLQAESGNLSLLRTAAASAPTGITVVLFDGLRHLPPFDSDIEAQAVPPAVHEWRRALAASDAVLIASPEYGHSLPGALKNGIDWVIGSGELERKAVAITASVPAPDRGRRGLNALRTTLGAVSATIVGGEPIVRGPNFEREVAELLRVLIDKAALGSESTRTQAVGTFEVTLDRHPPYDTAEGLTLSRVSIRKQFRGDLEGSSSVEMLSAVTAVHGSAGYVAIERVTGTLQRRSGSFVLQHSGTMTRGKAALTVSVVPDSGTAELEGISGTMNIDIVDGKHVYTFDYTLVTGA